jgi:hypothetical protein
MIYPQDDKTLILPRSERNLIVGFVKRGWKQEIEDLLSQDFIFGSDSSTFYMKHS